MHYIHRNTKLSNFDVHPTPYIGVGYVWIRVLMRQIERFSQDHQCFFVSDRSMTPHFGGELIEPPA